MEDHVENLQRKGIPAIFLRAVGAGPAAAGPILGQLTRAKTPYELWWVVQLLL